LNKPHLKWKKDLVVRFAGIEQVQFEVVNTVALVLLWFLEEKILHCAKASQVALTKEHLRMID